MARWDPNAAQRLVVAALELFEERGYDATGVIDIAQRAGLTKSTFFRHYTDKREVLFGRDQVGAALVTAIAGAPAHATAFDALAAGLDAVGASVFTEDRRELTARRRHVIAAHPDLQEREALKGLGQVSAMTEALSLRGVDAMTARVTADLGALALRLAYERWCDTSHGPHFPTLARSAIQQVRQAAHASTPAQRTPEASMSSQASGESDVSPAER